jgi:hypothetical protein
MNKEDQVTDQAHVVRQMRFSKLPEPIRLEDTIEERPALTHDSARDSYNVDDWIVRMGF